MKFPTVTGANLDRKQLTFPRDFGGQYNILLIPFYQRQQLTVNTWIPWAQALEKQDSRFRYYELPTLERMNRFRKWFINEGMRAGIPDPLARERTITLYLDKNEFRGSLGMPDENDIFILLVDRSGSVIARVRGAFSEEKGQQLIASVSPESAVQAP